LCSSTLVSAVDLAKGSSVLASSRESSELGAEKAVDGNPLTRWSSAHADPQWLQLDLGKLSRIERVVLHWETAHASSYEVQISDDAQAWAPLAAIQGGDGGTDDLLVKGSGRYVRILGTQRATIWGYSLYEVEVHGEALALNLARGKTVTVSSYANKTSRGALAVDGLVTTAWTSAVRDPQNLRVDFGSRHELSRVVLVWGANAARAYQVQLSDNGSTWREAFATSAGDGGTDVLRINAAGRYLRVLCTARLSSTTGVSIAELQAYGVHAPAILEPATGQVTLHSAATRVPLALKTNIAWSVKSDQTWLKLSPTSGYGTTTLNIDATANKGTTARTATLTFTGSGLTRKVSVTQQSAQASAKVRLPLELLGDPGTVEKATVYMQGAVAQASYLWLRTHRLSWREDGEYASVDLPLGNVRPGSKGSVRLNGGAWVPLTNSTVSAEGEAAELGGLNGSNMTVAVRLPVSALGAPGLRTGENLLEFRYDATDGITLGWRLLGLDLRTTTGVSLLTRNTEWDDPDTWVAPINTPADIEAGRQLWHNAPLVDLGFAKTLHPIKARCASCHFEDGYDLSYFNYSNKAIEARSRFHGLDATQARQVASYIRALDPKLPKGYTRKDLGRPWNPVYQPGPGLDAKPVELWAAGAGIDAVLERDEQMKDHLFPGGIYRPELLGAAGFLNPRETPQSLQYPDWNTWLPTIGLEDMVADPSLLAGSEQVLALRDATAWLENYRWNQALTDDWFLNIGIFKVQIFAGTRYKGIPGEFDYTNRDDPNRSRALELAQARKNLARVAWFNVRQFELITKYRLDAVTERGPAGGTPEVPAAYRSWGMPYRTVFETAPHFVADHAGLSFNFTQPGNYLSTAWYSLEQVFNGGYHAGGFGIDWNYHPFHIMGMRRGGTGYYSQGPIHAYRAAWSLLWMYQTIPTIDWRKDPVEPWTPKSFGFSQRQFGLGLEVAFGTDELVAAGRITPADQAQLQEALALAFLGIAERYTPDQWVRRPADTEAYRSAESFETVDYIASFNPAHSYDLPERGYQADAYYLRIKTLKERGLVTPGTLRRLVTWARGVWPRGHWDLLEP